MEIEKVKFNLSGDIGSKYWSYIAWRGTYYQKTASFERLEEYNKCTFFILGRLEELQKDISLDKIKEIDERMYKVIKSEAERTAWLFKTEVDDTASRDRETQLKNLISSS